MYPARVFVFQGARMASEGLREVSEGREHGGVGEGYTDRSSAYPQRLTVRDAAVALGISEGAVRMRIKRRTLPSTREGGRLYVLLNTDPTIDPERTHVRDNDRTNELIDTLRQQLEAERQAHAEARRIIAGLVERIPQLESPQEPPESPETPSETPPRTGPPEAERPAETRPWWRRVLGG